MDYSRQYGEITGPKVGCVGKTDLELELPSYTDWAGSKLEVGSLSGMGIVHKQRRNILSKGGLGTWSQAVTARGDGRPCVSPGLQPSQNAKKSTSFKMLAQFKRKLRRPNKIGL